MEAEVQPSWEDEEDELISQEEEEEAVVLAPHQIIEEEGMIKYDHDGMSKRGRMGQGMSRATSVKSLGTL
jgi:hypothetical protein